MKRKNYWEENHQLLDKGMPKRNMYYCYVKFPLPYFSITICSVISQDVKCKLEVIFIALKLLFQNYACILDKNVIAILMSNISLLLWQRQSFQAVFNLM